MNLMYSETNRLLDLLGALDLRWRAHNKNILALQANQRADLARIAGILEKHVNEVSIFKRCLQTLSNCLIVQKIENSDA
jgi:hypothetical protein